MIFIIGNVERKNYLKVFDKNSWKLKLEIVLGKDCLEEEIRLKTVASVAKRNIWNNQTNISID